MWRIIKAEFSCEKFKIILTFLFCIICFVTIWYGVKWEQNRSPMIMLIMLVGTIAISFFNEKTRLLQKRDIMYLALPIASRKVGFVHLVFPFICWINIVLLFYVSALVIQPFTDMTLTIPSFLHISSLNGLILFVIGAYLLHRDLKAVFVKQSQKTIIFIIWLISYIATLLPFYIVTNFGDFFGENTPLQLLLLKLSTSPILINAFGLLISVVSYLVFIYRKSYVQS